MYARLRKRIKNKCDKLNGYEYVYIRYGKSKQVRYLSNQLIAPIGYIKHSIPIQVSNKTNKYTENR